MSQLTIYKASAGSGKTYKLTEEYLFLIFSNPQNYKHILALTFTNKAASEMKNRIIEELWKLANEQETNFRKTLSSHFNISYQEIKERASGLLNCILHDFSKYAIGTIDSFFQRVFRVFIRELRLHMSYNLEFDTETVLKHAVDSLFFDLNENTTLRNWLTEFTLNTMDEKGSWNIEKNILSLGHEVFKEGYKLFDPDTIKLLQDKSFMTSYVEKLYQYKSSIETTLVQTAEESLKQISDHGLDIDDFSNKMRGAASIFYKYALKKFSPPNSYMLKGIDAPDNWYSKNSPRKNEIEQLVIFSLNNNLKILIQNFKLYASVHSVLKNIFTLGILTDISSRIIDYSNEQNRFVLNDVTKLLYSIMEGNDTPFIYEKLGNYYRHIMIDEFQDTSRMQWMNLKPLVIDMIAGNNKCLVIGDIKQSIYRWRNSDWSIMTESLPRDFASQGIMTENLPFNYRSRSNIIGFNNGLFKNASSLLQDVYNNELVGLDSDQNLIPFTHNMKDFYQDVEQNIPEKSKNSGGLIKIKKVEKDTNEDINFEILESISHYIEELEDNGFKARDIAILVRTKNEGKQVADYLIQYKDSKSADCPYNNDFISNESLFLETSRAIQLIIGVIKYIVNPDDKPNIARIKYIISLINDNKATQLHKLFNMQDMKKEEDLMLQILGIPMVSILALPVYELTELIIKSLKLNTKTTELPFLETFLDCIFAISQEERTSLQYVLEWWEDKGKKEAVQFSDLQDAIQILTIHKSKGLEFKAVIIPYCNWSIDNKPSIIWCSPTLSPINQLSQVPLIYSSGLNSTSFNKDYYEEKNKSYFDNLNLLYVAFTRACEALYVMLPFTDKNDKIKTVSDLIINSILHDETGELKKYWNNESGELTWGKLPKTNPDRMKDNVNSYELLKHVSSNISNRLALKFSSENYLTDKQDLFSDKINYGKLMHELFANIKLISDIDKVLLSFVMKGKINTKEAENIFKKTSQLFKNEKVRSWFSPAWKVKTEATILDKGGKTRRPDRVMMKDDKTVIIDYKFGQTEQPSHKKQVTEYMNYAQKMGLQDVEGYIWYVDQNMVVNC
ncbi:MAG: UvrD-helicase domain-containing protein [Bacteroidales bacterium]|nr:UvrD-helicase domain-containing protein [Bacteroidales bacterium]